MADGDVVVIGRYLPTDLSPYSDAGGGGGGGSTSYDPSLYRDTETADYPETNGPSTPDPGSTPPTVRDNSGYIADDVINRLRAAIRMIDAKIGGSTDADKVTTRDGKPVSLSDAYSKWLNLDFSVTHGVNYGPNSGGAQVGGGSQPAVTKVNDVTVVGYDRWPNGVGLNFMVLHELAHQTDQSTAYLKSVYDGWYRTATDKTDDAWKNSEQFKDTERYTNSIASSMASALNIPIMSAPPFGY